MTSLLRYDAARAALAEAVRIDEIQAVLSGAAAMRAYAAQAKDHELEANAIELRERAERRLGEMLVLAKGAGQISRGQPPKAENCAEAEQFSRLTLDDIGIDRKLSARAQKKAGIAQQAFEAMVARQRERILVRITSACSAPCSARSPTSRPG